MRQRGFSPVFIIIIIALIGVVGYLVYQNNQLKNALPIPVQTPHIIATNTPSPITPTTKPTIDPTANWKTYLDTKNGFEFKYPVDYTLTTTPESINVQKDPARALLYISVLDNPDRLSASQWFDSQPSQIREPIVSTHSRSSVTIAGQTAVKLVKQDGSNDFLIILTHGTKGYFVYFGPSSAEVIIANQILSTLKFTQ